MPSSRYIDVDGRPLHLLDHGGDGDLWLMVHGLGGSAGNWTPLAGHLAPRRVVALDLPGFGRTPRTESTSMATHARAVAGTIAQLGGSAVLAGNSMGGLVAEMVASDRPDLVSALVLIAPATPPEKMFTRPADPAVLVRLALQSLPGVGAPLTRYLTSSMSPEDQVDLTFALVAADPARLSPEFRAAAVELARARRSMPWTARAFNDAARSLRRVMLDRASFRSMIDAIAQPTLLIWGDGDRIVKPANLRWLAGLRPDWTSIEMPGVGHVPMAEVPRATFELITDWWETLARDPGGRGYSRNPGL